MKPKNEPYEEWLTTLRSSSPTLRQPEEMTNAIIGRIEALPKKRNKQYLLWGSWTSGLAAAFLLGFFVWETAFPPVPGHRTTGHLYTSPGKEAQEKPPQTMTAEGSSTEFGHLARKYPQLFRQPKDGKILLSETGSQIAAVLAQRQTDDQRRTRAIQKQIEATLK